MPKNNKKPKNPNSNKVGFMKTKQIFILTGDGNASKSQRKQYINVYNDWLIWKAQPD